MIRICCAAGNNKVFSFVVVHNMENLFNTASNMENLFNTASLAGIEQLFVDPCFKCQLRNECNDVEKFLEFEQSIAIQITDAKILYDVDV